MVSRGSLARGIWPERSTKGVNERDRVLITPMHSKVTVPVMFDGNMRRRHHRPWFFEDEHGDAVTVNQERHVDEALSPFWGS